MRSDEGMMRMIEGLRRDIERMQASEFATGEWTYLTTPLTSTSWDGDGYSTTARTLLDLSAVFSAPAGIKAVLIRIACRDSGSAAASSCLFLVAPVDTAGVLVGAVRLDGVANDQYREQTFVCPCDANGDIYFQNTATGAGTMDVILQIWGYCR